ncbi:MAG: hypothetical protein QOF48_3559 [Verrucomicrobiota bacterium]|jgi:hypothetical protein
MKTIAMSGCAALLLLGTGAFIQAAPVLERWVYCAKNIWVDKNVDDLEVLWRRAAKAGYSHVLLTDSKFAKLGDMDARYSKNVERLKKLALELNLEIVPALFPVGYSNDLLWHDPNLIEGLPVRDALFVIQEGIAVLQPELPVSFPGSDFADLNKWSWKDAAVKPDQGAACITDPNGQNARIVQKLKVLPFRQYHIDVRVKSAAFQGTPEVKVLGTSGGLNFNTLGVKGTQDWKVHHVVFNSLSNSEVNIYFGAWGGESGSLWFDDAHIAEVGFVNLIRRPGAPLVVKREDGTTLVEGRDYLPLSDPVMGAKPWNGAYDIFHEPPRLRSNLPDGTKLRVSYHHAVTVLEDQAMICPSEPRTIDLLREQARRLHAAWGAKGYMMSHDEIRVLNWCDACRARHLDAGALLADNVKTCIRILRELNPDGRIYVWSDMFDPHHNAHRDYYLVRGDLAGSWEGLDKEVIVVPWYFEQRAATLKFFAERGHRQLIAGYYDARPEKVQDWIRAASPHPGVLGVMYTTWQQKYSDLERFAEAVTAAK